MEKDVMVEFFQKHGRTMLIVVTCLVVGIVVGLCAKEKEDEVTVAINKKIEQRSTLYKRDVAYASGLVSISNQYIAISEAKQTNNSEMDKVDGELKALINYKISGKKTTK